MRVRVANASGLATGTSSTRPATRAVATFRATARDRGDAFELVAVHGAEDGNGRTVDGAVDRDQLEGHPLAGVERSCG